MHPTIQRDIDKAFPPRKRRVVSHIRKVRPKLDAGGVMIGKVRQYIPKNSPAGKAARRKPQLV